MASSKLQQLVEKRNAFNARIRKEQSKAKATERQGDTRRKILVGAMVLEKAKKDSAYYKTLLSELDAFIRENRNRILFDLPPLPEDEKPKRS